MKPDVDLRFTKLEVAVQRFLLGFGTLVHGVMVV